MSSVDYSRILKRSWQLSWKNKWLWVYGLILAIFGGSGGSGGGAGFSSLSFKKLINCRLVQKRSLNHLADFGYWINSSVNNWVHGGVDYSRLGQIRSHLRIASSRLRPVGQSGFHFPLRLNLAQKSDYLRHFGLSHRFSRSSCPPFSGFSRISFKR